MKKIDVNQILNGGATLLKREELMDINGGGNPTISPIGGDCLTIKCVSDWDCNAYCPKCLRDDFGSGCVTF